MIIFCLIFLFLFLFLPFFWVNLPCHYEKYPHFSALSIQDFPKVRFLNYLFTSFSFLLPAFHHFWNKNHNCQSRFCRKQKPFSCHIVKLVSSLSRPSFLSVWCFYSLLCVCFTNFLHLLCRTFALIFIFSWTPCSTLFLGLELHFIKAFSFIPKWLRHFSEKVKF